jgi:phage baseplate assembly protein W
MTDIPHFSSVFDLTANGADVDDQDSIDEIEGCVRNIVLCPVGFRLDQPDFGIQDPTFSAVPIDTQAIKRQVEQWEPRVTADVEDQGARFDPSSRAVTIGVSTRP